MGVDASVREEEKQSVDAQRRLSGQFASPAREREALPSGRNRGSQRRNEHLMVMHEVSSVKESLVRNPSCCFLACSTYLLKQGKLLFFHFMFVCFF